MNKNTRLFSDFPTVSTEEWEEKIKQDLKGADYKKKLIWKTIEGINVKPYYRTEDLHNLDYLNSHPGNFPYTRGNIKKNNDWEIRQDIKVNNIKEANKKALNALNKGATSIGFITEQKIETIKDTLFKKQDDFSRLLKNTHFDFINLNFISGNASPFILAFLDNEIGLRKIDINKINGSVDFDPIGYLTITGNFYKSENFAFSKGKEIIAFAKERLPFFRVLAVNGYFFSNSGSSIIQELAFSLALGVDYLVRFIEKGLHVDDIAPRMQFNFAVGSNYFMEIAKIRAARILWSKIIEAFYPTSEKVAKMFIHSATSDWNKTIYDPYINMLRTTTESMSSVIGGTDSLTVKPFDAAFRETTKFSERIARNTQIILKAEAHFDMVVDPAAGSYYIENLTNSIAEEAWKLFLIVEEKGGYLSAFKKGFIQNKIEETAQKRNNNIALRKDVLVGTNQFLNFNEKITDEIDPLVIKSTEVDLKEIIAQPLRRYRGAEEFEKLRLKTEFFKGTQPVVFMFTYGDPGIRKARSVFSCNFFASSGFKVIDNPGFNTIEEGVQASLKSQADIIVICSSDDEYAEIVPLIFKKLKNKAIIVVAGYPKKSIEKLKVIGIEHFIHANSNVPEILQGFQKALGIL